MTIALIAIEPTDTSSTVEAIITNMEGIITAMALNLEQMPSDSIQTTPSAFIDYNDEEFDDNFQEQPLYNTANFTIKIRAKGGTANADRDIKRIWTHRVKEAFTVAALNIGALVITKLVTRINHDGVTLGKEGEAVTIDYDIGVKYRVT